PRHHGARGKYPIRARRAVVLGHGFATGRSAPGGTRRNRRDVRFWAASTALPHRLCKNVKQITGLAGSGGGDVARDTALLRPPAVGRRRSSLVPPLICE